MRRPVRTLKEAEDAVALLSEEIERLKVTINDLRSVVKILEQRVRDLESAKR